ncbi:tail fiber assembly protein [Escherichia coli]|nr:tail fiber assembly protein [Escherichia coli]
MRTVSDHIALLQDDVDPENATEKEALLLENGRSFRLCCP